jgi:hypothetical protein
VRKEPLDPARPVAGTKAAAAGIAQRRDGMEALALEPMPRMAAGIQMPDHDHRRTAAHIGGHIFLQFARRVLRLHAAHDALHAVGPQQRLDLLQAQPAGRELAGHLTHAAARQAGRRRVGDLERRRNLLRRELARQAMQRVPDGRGRARGNLVVLLLEGDGLDPQRESKQMHVVPALDRKAPATTGVGIVLRVGGETGPADDGLRQRLDDDEAQIVGLQLGSVHRAVFERTLEGGSNRLRGGLEKMQPVRELVVAVVAARIVVGVIDHVAAVGVARFDDDRPRADFKQVLGQAAALRAVQRRRLFDDTPCRFDKGRERQYHQLHDDSSPPEMRA